MKRVVQWLAAVVIGTVVEATAIPVYLVVGLTLGAMQSVRWWWDDCGFVYRNLKPESTEPR